MKQMEVRICSDGSKDKWRSGALRLIDVTKRVEDEYTGMGIGRGSDRSK
jgi:hypothetical protein